MVWISAPTVQPWTVGIQQPDTEIIVGILANLFSLLIPSLRPSQSRRRRSRLGRSRPRRSRPLLAGPRLPPANWYVGLIILATAQHTYNLSHVGRPVSGPCSAGVILRLQTGP